MLLGTIADGDVYSLACDWITGNVYVGTREGYILVCSDEVPTRDLTCVTVLSNQGRHVEGISLDPSAG